MLEKIRHLVIEGPIGVGKTSLAKRLSERLRSQTLFEQPEANPFLERFYRDSARYAFPTQLAFLFKRIDQLRELGRRDRFDEIFVADFLLEKDALFASLTLADDELDLYRQIYSNLVVQAPVPDLVIYLEAPPAALLTRIAERGRPMEASISEAYLEQLCEAYTRFFYQYETSPLLTVNTEHLDPSNDDGDFELLLERVRQMRGRREFFNRGD
ncbi:MAG: deoxynucleoside kinase [Burkholderiaceae bacterium]